MDIAYRRHNLVGKVVFIYKLGIDRSSFFCLNDRMYAFIADVHMRPHSASDRERFLAGLTCLKALAEKIYILGDLFEYWYSGLEDEVPEVIAALADPGIHIMSGNRDFLMAAPSAPFPGMIRAEEVRMELFGQRILICHGHMLTERDIGFKCLHAVGWPLLRMLDKRMKLEWKHGLAEYLVRSSAVIRPPHGSISRGVALDKGVDTVICGHLHRGFISPELIVVPAFVDQAVYLGFDRRGAAFFRLD